MQNLKRNVEWLSSQESDIISQISNEERQPWKRQKKEVEVWLTNVQLSKDDVQRLEQEAVGETNVSSRMRLGKDIAKKILEVQELQKRGKDFNSLMIDELPTGRLPIPPMKDFVKCTKARNTENIWDCLMDDNIRQIGVYGMGGVGKTTIMEHIYNQLLEEKGKFDNVYWVTVSKAFDITNLQSNIAKSLNLRLREDEEEKTRASQLSETLSRQKRYVLILDDVWKPFALEKVGIPDPTKSNGCKLVLTTRSLGVCRMMVCTPVKVNLLTEEEALTLFLTKTVGHDTVLAPEVEEIAAQIAKKCACLPLAVVTLAGSLRRLKGIHEWRNALNEVINLTNDASDGVSTVIEQLKFSYSRLGNKMLQDCFLYCSLYPEDHKIHVNELIEYWIMEELITDMGDVEAQMDKGHAVLGELTRSCLLESCTNRWTQEECVRMHDLIRDMALKITASSPRFMVNAGETKKRVPYEPWSDDLERISFMYSFIIELPIAPPVCPWLTTLLLNGSSSSQLGVIPDYFFSNMPCLKVLNLSLRNITSLPESISNLENLHALILRGSHQLKYVPSLEKLKALKMFILTYSEIEELPKGIEELANLIKLDLSGNEILRTFPSCKLRRLSKLQDLRIVGKGVKEFQRLQKYILVVGEPWTGIVFDEGKEISISYKSVPFEHGVVQPVLPAGLEHFVVDGFHDPISLSKWFKDAKDLHKCFVKCCNGLESIFLSSTFSEDGQISLGTVESFHLYELPTLRVLFDGIAPPHNIYFNLKQLFITACDTLKNIFPVQLLQNFPNLEILHVDGCENVEDIIVEIAEVSDRGNHQDYSNSISLPKLKILFLNGLPRLKSIYNGVMVCPSLADVKVQMCEELRTIFHVQLLQNFPNLETLTVSGCENVEDIIVEIAEVSDRGNHQDYSNSISLPKLKNLALEYLPRLKSIYNGVMVCPSIEEVGVYKCPMVRRMPLSLHTDGEQTTRRPGLRPIYIPTAEEEWWESLEWDDPLTKTILQSFVEYDVDSSDDYSEDCDDGDDYSEDFDDDY
ncbi:hypothetical protein RHSIM_Rhsim11G0146700 [Rhododendron simsii]|uniref:NB-ARC domain-containing protein n=1 Tax=Rhododendron simsii TaxID=118357 RepID=A0A834G7B0_RHOSS|nr:hypothetical protein RHSIM_Rhsim11G0146700 [Rhododendron simsii]